MKPLRHPLVADARGHRLPSTTLRLAIRDHCLREAARRFCVGMSDRQAAAMLHAKISRYSDGRWRRTRADLSSPHDAGRIDALLWTILKVRDHVPSERLIRLALSSPGLFPAHAP